MAKDIKYILDTISASASTTTTTTIAGSGFISAGISGMASAFPYIPIEIKFGIEIKFKTEKAKLKKSWDTGDVGILGTAVVRPNEYKKLI